MNQFVKIVRFVTTFSIILRVFLEIMLESLYSFFCGSILLQNKNNKYIGNNYESSFRDLEVTVLTNKKPLKLKPCLQKYGQI